MLAKGVTCFFEVSRLSKPCGLYKLVLPQEQGLRNGYDASKLIVQGELNKVKYGHSFLNITGMRMGSFCLTTCMSLSVLSIMYPNVGYFHQNIPKFMNIHAKPLQVLFLHF